jgi:uncharacterized protein (TIGR02453 family)
MVRSAHPSGGQPANPYLPIMETALKFLKQLGKNNDKSWFDANRKTYETARQEYIDLIDQVIKGLKKTDPAIGEQTGKSCLFRINRDIRFSKDKSPYKTNFGASINAHGRSSMMPGYYVHLEPGKSFVGGGLYMAEPAMIKKIRQEIDYCFDEFKTILNAPAFKKSYGDLYAGEDVKLVRVPQGYEKDNPAAEYLKLKSWIVMRPVTDEEMKSPKAASMLIGHLEAMQPLLKFLNKALE